MASISLEDVLTMCSASKRVCPQPGRWNDVYALLERRSRAGEVEPPARPLILGAWWEASDAEKHARLKEQVTWAADHDLLEAVASLLSSLPEEDWYHAGE